MRNCFMFKPNHLYEFVNTDGVLQVKEFSPNVVLINTFDLPEFGLDSAVDFESYQKYSETGFNENATNNEIIDLLQCATGMASECGEIVDHVSKFAFHNSPFNKAKVASESGDFMWYFSNLLRLIGVPFHSVLLANKIKLDLRYPQGRDKSLLINMVKNIETEDAAIHDKLFK